MELRKSRFAAVFAFLIILSFVFMIFFYDIPANLTHLLQISSKRTAPANKDMSWDYESERLDAKYMWSGGNSFEKFAVFNRTRKTRRKLKLQRRKKEKKQKNGGIAVKEDRNTQHQVQRLPNAIIIGSKKGGTRAVLQHLKNHPKIKTCGKEVHFFDRNFDLGFSWYKSQMPFSNPGEITMEKTPAYFVTKMAPRRVNTMCTKFSINSKFIVILRDPVERAISDYTQGLEKHKKRLGSDFVKPSFESKVFKRHSNKEVNEQATIIRVGRYIEHLDNWLRYFSLSRFFFVSAERFVSEPWKELEGVQRFLNVSVTITKDSFWYNGTKKFYCIKEPDESGKNKAMCLGSTKGRSHPVISNETITILRRYYEPYNNELYRKIGRKLNWPSS